MTTQPLASPWISPLTREEAESHLSNQPSKCFLLRVSFSEKGGIVASSFDPSTKQIDHFFIKKTLAGWSGNSLGKTSHRNLGDLLFENLESKGFLHLKPWIAIFLIRQ